MQTKTRRMEQNEAITQTLTCKEVIEHSNALCQFVEGTSVVHQQIRKTFLDMENYFNQEKIIVNRPH
jgi:hypothetical protein